VYNSGFVGNEKLLARPLPIMVKVFISLIDLYLFGSGQRSLQPMPDKRPLK
jgi:hypothetical protein